MGFLHVNSVSLAGPGFVILNALKVMNIISFLTVITADVLMLVRIKTDSRFFFFEAVHHVITIIICIFLTASEIPLFPGWFKRNWPVFSPTHGFVALGLVMLVIGVETLGMLNEDSNSQDHLGMAFWRIIIGAGCLTFILGIFNIVASYVFRDRIVGVTARQVRAQGKPAILDARAMAEFQARGKSYTSSSSGGSSLRAKTPKVDVDVSPETKKSPKRWTQRFTKPILPVLPSYHQSQKNGGSRSPGVASSKYTFSDAGTEQHEMKISGPMGLNPHFANLPGKNPTSEWIDSVHDAVHPAFRVTDDFVPGLIRPDSSYHPYRHAK